MSLYLDVEFVTVNCGPSDSGGCNMDFAMTRTFYDETKRSGRTWHCPQGHPRAWGGKTVKQELEAERTRNQHLTDQLQAARDDAEETRRRLLRERTRFANGVCPCCNRSFQNVKRHMQTQHPEYDMARIDGHVVYECTCGLGFKTYHGLRIHQGRKHDPSPNAPRWRKHLTKV